MGLEPKKSTRRGPITAKYNFMGNGTPADPYVVHFNFSPGLGPGIEAIQAKLPEGVRVELEGIGYKLTTMTLDGEGLAKVFYDLATRMRWIRRLVK